MCPWRKGIGARFDEDLLLFFKLRGVDFQSLLKKSIDQKMQSLLKIRERNQAGSSTTKMRRNCFSCELMLVNNNRRRKRTHRFLRLFAILGMGTKSSRM